MQVSSISTGQGWCCRSTLAGNTDASCLRRSIPAVTNVAYVLFLLMYLWAIVGMNLWGNIKQVRGNEGINRHANFRHFPVSMITEFRCAWTQATAGRGGVHCVCMCCTCAFKQELRTRRDVRSWVKQAGEGSGWMSWGRERLDELG